MLFHSHSDIYDGNKLLILMEKIKVRIFTTI